MSRSRCVGPLVIAIAALVGGSALAAPTVLRASHQFPGGKGDVRDEMVQIIARDAKAAGVDLEVQVYPGASLFKPNEQWNALVNGQLDISSFPLDYASGKVRAFGATLMPGLVRSHERAARLNDSKFMKDIKAKIDKAGVHRALGRLARRRHRLEEGLHPHARRHQGPEGPLGRPDLRRDVAGRRRIDRVDPEQRGLQRAADRRGRGDRHQHRAASSRSASTSRSSASPRRATTRCGSCTSRC